MEQRFGAASYLGRSVISPAKSTSMRAYSFVILLGILVLAACKPETASTTEEVVNNETTPPTEAPAVAPSSEAIPGLGHDATFITHQLWHYRGIMSPDVSPDAMDGEWIDFDPSGTFKAGKGQAETYGGTWFYNEDARLLGILPADPAHKRSEWQVKYNGEVMVLVGTAALGNQSTQMRLVRHAERPQ